MSRQSRLKPEHELSSLTYPPTRVQDRLPTVFPLPTKIVTHEVSYYELSQRIHCTAFVSGTAPLSLAKEDTGPNMLNGIDPATVRGKQIVQRICEDLRSLLMLEPLQYLAVYTENLIGPKPPYLSSWYGLTIDQMKRKWPAGRTPPKYRARGTWGLPHSTMGKELAIKDEK